MSEKKKILLAMSGGVDSSVSAWLLKKQGYDLVGVYFRMTEKKTEESRAREVCRLLGVKFYPINISEKFQEEVIDYFIASYERGETPNPCTRCNKVIKFRELLRVADELGIEEVASGHYVRIENNESGVRGHEYSLFRGIDSKKDQSYFLYRLGQEELSRIVFPLGELKKTDVKEIARQQGLPDFKGESQDVCFLVKNGRIIDHNELLRENIKLQSGKIIDQDGNEVGEHQGLPLYTIGQRRGVEIGGTGPYYVTKCDYKNNVLFVTNDPQDKFLYSTEFIIKDCSWVSGREPELPFECEVAVRYRGKAVECGIVPVKNEKFVFGSGRGSKNNNHYQVKLKRPERAVTSGQSAVFYRGNEVVGGGIIVLS